MSICLYVINKPLIILGARLWTPFKELYDAVDTVLLKKQMESLHDLEVILRRHKPDFLTLLKSPVGF